MTFSLRTLLRETAKKLLVILVFLGLIFVFFVVPYNNVSAQTPIVIGSGFLNSLYGFVIILGGKLVGWSGKLLNWAVADFVVGFGDVYLVWGVGVAVENGWKMIRDVLNITFIFGIVYIGIRLIFDADDSSAKRSLGYLLAAALLINFSLFISKFVVDFSNSLAAVIYTTGLAKASEDLGSSFINLLGLSTLIDNGTGGIDLGSNVSGGLAVIFGTFIFMLMATYALAAGAFLIFVRGIALIFFMIFSPVMFLGWIFPQFRNFTSKYWSLFLSNAFMAPSYLFCIYLTFMIMHGFKYQIRTTGNGSMGNLFVTGDNINALVVFTLAIGLMLASISVAKRMGAFGGGLVVSAGNSMRKGAQGMIFRNTVGLGAQELKNVTGSQTMSNVAGYIPGGRLLQRSAFRSFDSVTKYGAGGTSLAQRRSADKATDSEMRQNRVRIAQDTRERQRNRELEAQLAALEDNTTSVNDLEEAMNGLGRNIREMSNDERSALGYSRLTNHHIASNLTDAHIDSLASSGNYSPQEITGIRAARRQAQVNIAQHGFATTSNTGGVVGASNTAVRTGGAAAIHQDAQRRRLVSGGNTALGNLPVGALTQANMLPLVTPRIVEERMRNGISETERIELRDAIGAFHGFPMSMATHTYTPAAGSAWENWRRSHPQYGDELFR